jgi:hypothetical protein
MNAKPYLNPTQEAPYTRWLSIVRDPHNPAVKSSFFLNVGGAVFNIDFGDWLLLFLY